MLPDDFRPASGQRLHHKPLYGNFDYNFNGSIPDIAVVDHGSDTAYTDASAVFLSRTVGKSVDVPQVSATWFRLNGLGKIGRMGWNQRKNWDNDPADEIIVSGEWLLCHR